MKILLFLTSHAGGENKLSINLAWPYSYIYHIRIVVQNSQEFYHISVAIQHS